MIKINMNKIMENNEQNTQEETQEVNTATGAEQTEETQGQEETKDWKADALKWKAIAERKDKKLQNAQTQTEGDTTIKNNNPQSGLSREEAIFYAQGGTEETFAIAKKIADVQGVSILVAREDSYFKHEVAEMEAKAKADANTMPASGGSPNFQPKREKAVGEMTREEHQEHLKKRLEG